LKTLLRLSFAIALVAAPACATDGSANGSGGSTSGSGGSGSGGKSTGGNSGNGGTSGSGGATGSGGGATGGTSGNGGSGENAASGGNTGSGGNGGTGGAGSDGGSGGNGGTGGSGGSSGNSGSTGNGGTSANGGSSASGGIGGNGGSSASGGATGSGGKSTGGVSGGGAAGNVGGGTGSGGSGSGGTATGGSGGTGGSTGACSTSEDACPATKGGVTVNCKKRFMYGVNYAWSSFAGDFGGIPSWSQKGVAADKAARATDLTDMKNNGVDVVRWWMFPDLGGDGIHLDSSKTPSGIGSTVVDDLNAALDIAAQLDIHIKLTLFSFDSFWNDFTDSGITFPSLQPIAIDATKRAALIKNVVIPIAQAVEASPNKDRMVAWDVINEPEWSITGSDPYGDQAFDPSTGGSNNKTMATVTFAQMETFVKDIVTALHGASSAQVTVGSAAVKWAKAWSQVGLDFYDFHWYGWVDQYFPHTKTPTDYKVDDKPVVVGEFPLNPSSDTTGQSFGGITYGKLVDDFLAAGYAGTQGWAFSDTSAAFSWANAKSNVKSWASAHTCYTHY